MPAARALDTNILEYKTLLRPIEGTDPIQYYESYEEILVSSVLDMNNFQYISKYINEYGEVDGKKVIVSLLDGQQITLEHEYESVYSAYLNYLNGGG